LKGEVDMANQTVCIVGMTAAGVDAALKLRQESPDHEIILLTEEEHIPYLELPYYLGNLYKDKYTHSYQKNVAYLAAEQNIQLWTEHKLSAILPSEKKVMVDDLKSGERKEIQYDMLMLDTGTTLVMPSIEGILLHNILPLRRLKDILEIKERIEQGLVKKAVVVGGDILGIQTAENLILHGIPTTIIEKRTTLLSDFDPEIALLMEGYLAKRGVEVLTNERVLSFIGNTRNEVVEVHTPDHIIQCDLVVWTDDLRPDVAVAIQAQIGIGSTGAIRVNGLMETDTPGIYAIGSCAEQRNLITGAPVWYPQGGNGWHGLSSVEDRDDEEAEEMAYGPGTLGTKMMKAFHIYVGKTGFSAWEAEQAGFSVDALLVPSNDQVHSYPGYKGMITKIVVDKKDRRVLGAQMIGEGRVDQSLDTFVTLISLKGKLDDLASMDFTHSPVYLFHRNAAMVAAWKMLHSLAYGIHVTSPAELDQRRKDPSVALLDLRSEEEVQREELSGCLHIPFHTLRDRLDELDRDKSWILLSQYGNRAVMAFLILQKAGFHHISVLEGGLAAYIPCPKGREQMENYPQDQTV